MVTPKALESFSYTLPDPLSTSGLNILPTSLHFCQILFSPLPVKMTLQYSTKNLPKQIFINNEYVDSKNSKKLTLHNPKDGSLIADDVPLAGEQDVDAAVEAAEKAFVGWKKMGANQRRNILLKFADLIEKNANEIAQLSRISLGAPASFGAFEGGLCAEVCQ
jgi:aldehyde dehydrogenase (NAD+)